MSAARLLQDYTDDDDWAALPLFRAASQRQAEGHRHARLADETAVPTPSPVHRLQAELAEFAAPTAVPDPDLGQAVAVALYPGWFRVAFPIAASGALWAAIVMAVGALR